MDLSKYVRIAAYDLPEPTRTSAPTGNLLAQEASGVTYNWDTNTLFVIADNGTAITQVSLTGQFIDTMTLAPGASPQGTTFYDTESISYIGNGQFVFTEERWRQVDQITYTAGTTLTRGDALTVDLGADIGNTGLEGITYDPLSGGFILVKEKDPLGVFQTTINFATGLASNGSSTTVNSINLFDPAKVGTTDLSDVYALSSNASFIGTTQEDHLLILSQESGKIVEIGRDGTVYSELQLVAPSTPSGIDLAAMTVEGMTMDAQGRIYLVNEQGGGDANHPQLWVYAPIGGPNQAPTGVSLTTPAAAILENTDASARIKVADIAIQDDAQGVNSVTLTGADAAAFEVDGAELYLKAGTVLDYESKASFAVTVNVDDATVGGAVDASTSYTLKVANVVNEGPAGSVAVTEVAPWSSGSAVGADWFELTNTGSTAINLTGWKVDDSSYSASSAVALNGVTTIAPGESVVFIETSSTATVQTFIDTWFGGVKPAGLQIGTYTGSGVGLSTGGDAIAVFDGAGTLKASVSFGASPAELTTFDNADQLNSTSLVSHVTVEDLSADGVNGAFAAANDASQTGSPGTIGGVPAPVNQAPTAIGLSSEITDLSDTTSTASRVKVASIIVTDDHLGVNNLSVGGADAAYFEVDASGLYIKAGTVLDAAAKAHYDVTVSVDDPTLGATPDASVDFSLELTHAAANPLRITEVAPWSSGDSPFGADWFEVTNITDGAVAIGGWRVDDNSNAFANSVALTGVSSIAAGESVIFIETSSAATVQGFIDTWFGGAAPAGLQIGTYSGSGVGLSTGGDALNLYDSTGALQANVTFGAATTGPFATFDNAAETNNAGVTTLSAAGVNGAFAAAADSAEIGSPGMVAAGPNQAPTAIALSNVIGQIHEGVGTASQIKVADVLVIDDGLGGNALSLSGADAGLFEINGGGLFLKAGAVLDYETKSSYAITVSVNDATVGDTPDASTSYALKVVDVANEGGGAPLVRITEVAPWSSGNSPVGADWFEITNTGSSTANLSGWKMDDNSFSAANAVALKGVVTLGAGESAVFVEGTAETARAFIDTWFGGEAPTGLQVGYYAGSGVSLSTGGDGVALFDGAGAMQAKVSFGSSPAGPYATFDNAAGADNVTISALSDVGLHGAFAAAGDAFEIGSPGSVNEAPRAVADTGTALIEDGVLAAAGNVLANDSDAEGEPLTVTRARVGGASTGGVSATVVGATLVHGLYGDLTINPDGSYSYALDNARAAVQALNAGQHVSEVFTYAVADAHGASNTAELSFDLSGADEGPPPITGTHGVDKLDGTNGADLILGLGGDDKLFGDNGDDTLIGGAGRDVLNGGDGIDTASYAGAASGVSADLGSKKAAAGEALGDSFTKIENLTGSAFDDTLYGDQGDNVISGGAGDDVIAGGKGADTLAGGAGADVFVFDKDSADKVGDGADVIIDFLQGVDRIDLSAIDANGKKPNTDDAFVLIGSAAFHKVAGELRYETSGPDFHLFGDLDGDGTADFIIQIKGISSLTAADFIL